MAMGTGLQTLRESALERLAAQVTTVEEVVRVTGTFQNDAPGA
jgi:type II secretory ATPase GspE/PulE/Tfp pilus assembly ATPase PilB-like protein